ncbi:MAG: hypothetical protein AAF713_19420 [Pseudomonadota bacterium]
MAKIIETRRFLAAAPREAWTDVTGFAALCLMVFAGFCAPVFF